MRLCHVVPSLAERHGGPSKSVRALVRQLARGGADVTLFSTAEPGEAPPPGSDEPAVTRIFPRVAPRRLARSPVLREHLWSTPFDCVHHHSLWLLTLRYAAAGARHQGRPLVISPRGMLSGWAHRHHRGRKLLAEWLVHPGAFGQAAGWHATSPAEADDIHRLGFRQPICVSPNGVEAPSAAGLAAARAAWWETCPATRHRPVALFYSRLHRKKRVRELIDAWLAVPRGDWLLLIVGTTEEYSAAELAAAIGQRRAGEKIVVADGAGRPAPYAVGSLFLLPSHSENFGLVVAEALAAGLPALVTDTTPWSGLAAAGGGWCVPWESYPASLATALATAPDELRAMGTRGAAWVARDFSWETAAQLLQEFYQHLRHASP